MKLAWLTAVTLALHGLVAPAESHAQGGGDTQSARQAAPVDMTGYWVAVVTEDWRFRMLTPPKGDYDSVPLNAEGQRVADTWDPARDVAEGEECRWYGAASLMSVPGRLHITWENDDTLRIDTDAGMQTRLFHFDEPLPPSAPPARQGFSAATWRASEGGREPGSLPGGSLEVLTAHMLPGYLRRNGVPYSEDARLAEYYYVLEDAGVTWLVVIGVVEDPRYLTQPFVRSRQFKREANGSGFSPAACAAG